MSDFFVNFYKQDQLGKLCNWHMQLADRSPLNTLDPLCIKLAAMASTAVDFSKTGIAVKDEDIREFPKLLKKGRPHFMALTPRIEIDKNGDLDIEEIDEDVDDQDFDGLDVDKRRMRYYKSTKILGTLFDTVDERGFLDDVRHLQNGFCSVREDADEIKTMRCLLQYMLHWAQQYAILFDHHLELVTNIREWFVLARFGYR